MCILLPRLQTQTVIGATACYARLERTPTRRRVHYVRNAGTFDESGVLDLNRRAEPEMTRLGVPMVHAYDITQGQLWATLPADGR